MSGFREVAPLPLERPLTYDDVSEHVYGMPAKAWKDKYQLPASPEAMAKYNGSKAHHAKHLKDVQTDVDASSKLMCAPPAGQATSEVQLDPCCPDPTEPVAIVESPIRGLPEPPAVTLGVRLLTVSDRAFNGVYSDESGPMIRKCLGEYTARFPQVRFRLASSEVVPDEEETIAKTLRMWSDPETEGSPCDLIITTGGTGFSKRDVTPEATIRVVDVQLPSLVLSILSETSKKEPLAFLSRGVAGIARSTLILNSPGNPNAVREWMTCLPLLVHACSALKAPPPPHASPTRPP